jgi:hypothetical protein
MLVAESKIFNTALGKEGNRPYLALELECDVPYRHFNWRPFVQSGHLPLVKTDRDATAREHINRLWRPLSSIQRIGIDLPEHPHSLGNQNRRGRAQLALSQFALKQNLPQFDIEEVAAGWEAQVARHKVDMRVGDRDYRVPAVEIAEAGIRLALASMEWQGDVHARFTSI